MPLISMTAALAAVRTNHGAHQTELEVLNALIMIALRLPVNMTHVGAANTRGEVITRGRTDGGVTMTGTSASRVSTMVGVMSADQMRTDDKMDVTLGPTTVTSARSNARTRGGPMPKIMRAERRALSAVIRPRLLP